jgi:hypothetical protein
MTIRTNTAFENNVLLMHYAKILGLGALGATSLRKVRNMPTVTLTSPMPTAIIAVLTNVLVYVLVAAGAIVGVLTTFAQPPAIASRDAHHG